MGSLSGCIAKAGALLSAKDRATLNEAALKMRAAGGDRVEAEKTAVAQVIEALRKAEPKEATKAGVAFDPRRVMSQISPEISRGLKTPVRMPADEAFDAAVRNTPGASVSEHGLRLDLTRFQKPEQEGEQSVRTGVFYLPTGSPAARHYKTGPGKADGSYGGSVRMQGEAELRAPLFVKGATGGKAPEAAYDQIKGKGAAKKLANEAMSVVTSRGWMNRTDPGVHEELVRRFLSEHGADPNMAHELIRSSSKGNQMRYALQENVIAHAVRSAGYDSVVGYGKHKDGPRISEVFDVRELTYPSNVLSPQVHDMFYQSAYHGSPYRFTKFTLDHLGEGEGTQVFGHGLYFASLKDVAEFYRGIATAKTGDKGQTYKVEIPEDTVLLDRNAPVSKQPDVVRAALEKLGFPSERFRVTEGKGAGVYDTVEQARAALKKSGDAGAIKREPSKLTGAEIYTALSKKLGSDKAASDALLDAGVLGLKYLDAHSRATVSEGRSHNYVIFRGEDVEIRDMLYQTARPAQTDTPEFKAWFGDSKVVDAQGKPLVVYHGTQADFATFKNGLNKVPGERGIFFSADPAVASAYAGFDPDGNFHAQEVGSVMPVFLSIKNPLVVDFKGERLGRVDAIRRARDGGHDGVILRNHYDAGGVQDQYVVFRPEQIKSVFNRGTFDPNDPSILRQDESGPLGGYDPASRTMIFTPRANLSTALHESAHHFLELSRAFASAPDAPAQIKADFDILLRTYGVKGDTPEARLADWNGRDLEAQRAVHERFATEFERYLFEGKAPTQALQPLFSRFRTWMVALYQRLMGSPQGLPDLSPEVRGVMDRMLASEAAIKEAESSRAYVELPRDVFKDDESFEQYRALGREATESAIDEMSRRSLKDMRWLSNARSAALREIQARVESTRREVRIAARRDILQDPVYQAWQFLTMRSDEAGRAIPERRTGGVDPRQDSLVQAIAKLGGIDRESARLDLGIAEDVLRTAGEGIGKPAFRKIGGKSADDMRQSLEDMGYLRERDEFGRSDLRGLADAINNDVGGQPERSWWFSFNADDRPQGFDLDVTSNGKLNTEALRRIFGTGPAAPWRKLSRLGMTSDTRGVDPEVVAISFGFDDARHMVESLASAKTPERAIEEHTDRLMLIEHGDLVDPKAIDEAANAAVHNGARARFLATGLKVLTKSPVPVAELVRAAKETAAGMIGERKIGDLRVDTYLAAERRANKEVLVKVAKDPAAAIEAQRQAMLANRLAKTALDARAEVDKGLAYLKKMADGPDSIAIDARDQITAILERFELGGARKRADTMRTLAQWIEGQKELGIEPDIPPEIMAEAFRTNYRELTVDQFRGLVDSIKQIEHLGRLENRLLTARRQETFAQARDAMVESVVANAAGRVAEVRSSNTVTGRAIEAMRDFWASHITAAMFARRFDGGKDGGVVWEHLIRPANERGHWEVEQRAKATRDLVDIMKPVFALGRMGGNGEMFPSIGRKLNRQARLAFALNRGNDGNLQRLLDGNGYTIEQIQPVLESLTAAEWKAVQGVWDYMETFRPLIAAKERRVMGREPEWVESTPFTVKTADGQTLRLRGGYYPIKYDSRASARAETHQLAEDIAQQMRGAYTSATTRRSFTKARVDEVHNRPLLESLDGIYSGVQDVIHDLAWHEYLIDANRLMRDEALSQTIRSTWGPEAHQQLRTWLTDVAAGEAAARQAGERAVSWVRQGVSIAGLGFNVMNAMLQPLGFTQSISRIGPQWVGRGVAKALGSPMETAGQISDMSPFMRTRFMTRFRELNELRNVVQGQSKARSALDAGAYALMLRFQQLVDIPTWWGAYEKAIAEGSDQGRAAALADQAIIDSQGSGMVKDMASVMRGGQFQKLFTSFYTFFNTTFNLATERTASSQNKAALAAQYLLLFALPATMAAALKDALTPGESDDWSEEKIARKLLGENLGYLLNTMFLVRELGNPVSQSVKGEPFGTDYSGPAGLRMIGDASKVISKITKPDEVEWNDSLRKAVVNLAGDLARLPAAQINRTITGVQALREGKTSNPAAVLFGYQEQR